MKDKRNTLIKLKLDWILQNIKVVEEYGYQSNLYIMPIKADLSVQKFWEFLRNFFFSSNGKGTYKATFVLCPS